MRFDHALTGHVGRLRNIIGHSSGRPRTTNQQTCLQLGGTLPQLSSWSWRTSHKSEGCIRAIECTSLRVQWRSTLLATVLASSFPSSFKAVAPPKRPDADEGLRKQLESVLAEKVQRLSLSHTRSDSDSHSDSHSHSHSHSHSPSLPRSLPRTVNHPCDDRRSRPRD